MTYLFLYLLLCICFSLIKVCEFCAMRMSRRHSVLWSVFSLIFIFLCYDPKLTLHGHSACSCIMISMGGSYASGALSAFLRVSRHNTFCYVLICQLVSCLYLFLLSNKHFQVQVQVCTANASYIFIMSQVFPWVIKLKAIHATCCSTDCHFLWMATRM